MIANLIWFVPAASVLILLGVLYRLGMSAKRLDRQSKRLDKTLKAFRETDHSASLAPFNFEALDLQAAEANRRLFIKHRSKSKQERQRRLVKRLRDLKSKESE